VHRLHGEDAAESAEKDFETRFRRREMPEDVPERTVADLEDLAGVLVEAGLARSRGDARRLIAQGGVRVNGEKIGLDWKLREGDVVQAGKRNFVRIRKR
jgi:tyrosyl-tRNA synthetase